MMVMLSKNQRSWCQFCEVTVIWRAQIGLQTTACGRLRVPSQLSTPLYSQFTLLIYAVINGLVGGPKVILSPGTGNPSYATALR